VARARKPTSTSNFGVGRRESHDATAFYERFAAEAPDLDDSDDVHWPNPDSLDTIFEGPAQALIPERVEPNSIALVVTSPPYFAGKEYEEALGQGEIPASYAEYLLMLEAVFDACKDALEPGGRIAVNVANLGRRPFRSLSSDVTRILQELGFLLRGEVIWIKGKGATGSTAWGSFQNAANPVLRDLTERIVVASKGRFDRALSRQRREREGRPSVVADLSKEDFMELTTDVWEFPPERATLVGHPAPFPVELPDRFIRLYTYQHDLVLDPFMGSGTTAVAAIRNDRHFVGFDTDPDYISAANARIADERARHARTRDARDQRRVVLPIPSRAPEGEDPMRRAVREGHRAKEIAKELLPQLGFDIVAENRRFPSGVQVDFVARDQRGGTWHVDVSGAFTSSRPGLRRTDTLWKALGKAAVLNGNENPPLLLLTTDLPATGSAGFKAIKAARGGVIVDAIEMLTEAGQDRLREYAAGATRGPVGDLLGSDE
jgi:DNA modification methylase